VAVVTTRRFPPPWSTDELNDACFIVKDSAAQKLGYFYFDDEPGRRSAAKLLATFNLGIRTGSTWDCP